MDEESAPADPVDFDEALAWFLERTPMPDTELTRLARQQGKKAFTVAGVTQLNMVTDVWRALESAIQNGDTLEEFKASVGDQLTSAWGSAQPWRVETIFRTNIQAAYGAGRYTQATHPAVKRARPYWQFSAVMDSRTSQICQPLNGLTFLADAPFWADKNPPLHFNCRSTIITLSQEEAGEAGIDTEDPDLPDAAEGFGGHPDSEWTPDLEDYPEPLVAQMPGR